MGRTFFRLHAVLLFLFFPCFVFSDEVEVKAVHFAEEANWPPFTPDYYGKTTEGLSFQLMKEIFAPLGIAIDLTLYPQKRMLEYVRSGRKDAATVISKNSERDLFLDYSETLLKKRGLIYYLHARETPICWQSYKDLTGLRIGVVAGHNYGDAFNRGVKEFGLHLVELEQVQQGFDMLLSGRVDVFFCIELSAKKILGQKKYMEKFAHAEKPYFSKGYHIGFSKKSEARFLIPKVNQVIRQMKEDGSLEKIISQHLK